MTHETFDQEEALLAKDDWMNAEPTDKELELYEKMLEEEGPQPGEDAAVLDDEELDIMRIEDDAREIEASQNS